MENPIDNEPSIHTTELTKEQILNKIMSALETVGELDTLQVSKKVFGAKGTKKMVNVYLYDLLKQNKIEKIEKQGIPRPFWKLKVA